MISNYQIVRVADIASQEDGAISIGPFGSSMKADLYVSSGVPVIRGTNISTGKKIAGDFVYISETDARRLRRSALRSNDIFFPHRGAIGQVGILKDQWALQPIMSSSLMKLRVDLSIADPDFIFWYFKSAAGQREILQYASTVGTPGIGQPLTSLRAMRLPLPNLITQREIAFILNMLDDKIELNRETAVTLEAMARSFYRSWFVDFDPVWAKLEDRRPAHMNDATAALFPDAFDDEVLIVTEN